MEYDVPPVEDDDENTPAEEDFEQPRQAQVSRTPQMPQEAPSPRVLEVISNRDKQVSYSDLDALRRSMKDEVKEMLGINQRELIAAINEGRYVPPPIPSTPMIPDMKGNDGNAATIGAFAHLLSKAQEENAINNRAMMEEVKRMNTEVLSQTKERSSSNLNAPSAPSTIETVKVVMEMLKPILEAMNKPAPTPPPQVESKMDKLSELILTSTIKKMNEPPLPMPQTSPGDELGIIGKAFNIIDKIKERVEPQGELPMAAPGERPSIISSFLSNPMMFQKIMEMFSNVINMANSSKVPDNQEIDKLKDGLMKLTTFLQKKQIIDEQEKIILQEKIKNDVIEALRSIKNDPRILVGVSKSETARVIKKQIEDSVEKIDQKIKATEPPVKLNTNVLKTQTPKQRIRARAERKNYNESATADSGIRDKSVNSETTGDFAHPVEDELTSDN